MRFIFDKCFKCLDWYILNGNIFFGFPNHNNGVLLFNLENLDLIEILRKDDKIESNIINIDFDSEFWEEQILQRIKIYIADFLKTYILD